MPYKQTGSVTIKNNQIFFGNELLFAQPPLSGELFLQAAYLHFEINYPKFFKMDNVCKTGFMAAEILLRQADFASHYLPEQKGIVLGTRNGSIDTDEKYQASTLTAPSPSLFVYTLPNILLGELSIRHQIKGEAACFVFDIFDSVFQGEYIQMLFETKQLKNCICGWADFYKGNAEASFSIFESINTKN